MTRPNKLLLIAPASLEVRKAKGKYAHHLSLAMVAGLATPFFDEIRIVEETFEPLDLSETADLVGITMMTCQATRGYELADHFRKRGIPTICGGSHASFMVEECSQRFDAVVVNEAELVWPQIMADLQAGALKQVYRADSFVELKDLPMPRKDLFLAGHTTLNTQVLQTSRGCPLGCNFCTVTKMYGSRHRTRPVEHVVEEIKRFPSRIFFFVDDNIFFTKEYAYKLFEALIPMKIKWGSQGSLEMIARDEKLLKLAVDSGCISLFVGIESIDQGTLNLANKSFNKVRDYETHIRKITRAGINLIGAFMFGFDQDTRETLNGVYDFAMRNRLALVNTGIMTPFPGTAFYDTALREKRIFDFNWEHYTGANLVCHHPTMNREEIEAIHLRFPKRFYTWRSILKRFWANRSQPLYYFIMNLSHWWRAHHRKPHEACEYAS
ncbi:MAG: radical SAM protein [Pseudomonadota bacterium]